MLCSMATLVLCAAFDVVECKDGSRTVGSVLRPGEPSEATVSVLTPFGVQTIPGHEVRRVLRATDFSRNLKELRREADSIPAQLSIARWCIDRGLYEEGLAELAAVLGRPEAGAHATTVEAFVRDVSPRVLLGEIPPFGTWTEVQQRKLLAAVASDDAGRAAIAESWLLARPPEENRALLESGLDHKSAAVRLASARLLGRQHHPSSLPALIARSLLDRQESVRSTALEAALQYDPLRVSRPYIRAIESEVPETRAVAYAAIARLQPAAAIPALIQALRPVRRIANSGGSPRSHVSFITHITFVQDFEVEIAQGAVIADPIVGVLQEGTVLDVKVASSASMPRRERAIVSELLGRLTGLPYGDDYPRWKAWWEARNKQGE